MGDQHRRRPDISGVGNERAARAEQFRLVHQIDLCVPRRGGDMIPHARGQMVRVDQDALDPRAAQQIEPVVEQRAAVDRHKAFRGGGGDRPQSGAQASGKEQRRASEFSRRPSKARRRCPLAGSACCRRAPLCTRRPARRDRHRTTDRRPPQAPLLRRQRSNRPRPIRTSLGSVLKAGRRSVRMRCPCARAAADPQRRASPQPVPPAPCAAELRQCPRGRTKLPQREPRLAFGRRDEVHAGEARDVAVLRGGLGLSAARRTPRADAASVSAATRRCGRQP